MGEGGKKKRESDLPAIPNHADTLILRSAIELGALLEVLFTAYSLGVTETRFSQGVCVSPSYNSVSR